MQPRTFFIPFVKNNDWSGHGLSGRSTSYAPVHMDTWEHTHEHIMDTWAHTWAHTHEHMGTHMGTHMHMNTWMGTHT